MNEERSQLWRVHTPEGVAFSFRLASPALRAVAQTIDACVVAAAWSLLSVIIKLLHLISPDFAGMLAFVLYFVLSQGYRMACEWLWRGQTLGKRVLRLRVVDERGLRLTFAQVVLRNLLRFVDALPAAYLVGGVAALVSRRAQRLGDLAAGTLVIWEPAEPSPDPAIFRGEKYNSLRSHPALVARLRQTVTPGEAQAAWRALARRDRLDAGARVRLFAELAAHFRASTSFPLDTVEAVSDEQLVRNIVDVLFLSRSNFS